MAKSTQANFDGIDSADAHAQGLDGGLNLKTDSSRLAPPATTRSDNAWYLQPGNVQQLPAPASVMQASTNHVYNVHARDLQQPSSTGDVMVHGEVLDLPGSSVNRFTTPCWSDGNGTTFNTQQPCLPTAMRSRILTGRMSISGSATSDLCNAMMARQESGYSTAAPQRYALGYYNSSTGVFNATFGLVDGQIETAETLSLTVSADYCEMAGVQGTNYWLLMVISGATLTVYGYDFKGNQVFAARTVSSQCLSTTYLSSGSYAGCTIFQHAGRTFVAYVNNPSGSSDGLYLYDVLTQSSIVSPVTSASAPNYGFAVASPYSHTTPTGTIFYSVLYGNQVFVVAQTSNTAAGSLVGTTSTLALATKTGYDSSQSPTGNVNFQATMSCCAFDGVGINTTASLGITVFRHFPEQITRSDSAVYWYQQISADRVSFQANATTATSTGTIASLGQNVFRVPSGAQLCSKAFNLQPGEGLGAGLSAAKNAYVLVRSGGVEPYGGFSGNNSSSGNPYYNWWTYGQPTYFILDHQARIVGRAYERLGPPDASYNLANNGFYRGAGVTGTAWGTGVQLKSLATPLIIAPNNDMSVLDITMPCWVQTAGSTNVIKAYGSYQGVPNNMILQPAAIMLSLSAQGASVPPVQAGPYTVVSGALTCIHDGRGVVEANYHFRAHNPQISLATTTTSPGMGAAGVYYYAVVWEWYDSLGRVHRSEPSLPFANTVVSGNYFNGATVFCPLPATAKSAVGGVMYARLYRSSVNNTDKVFYLVSTTTITGQAAGNQWASLTDASGASGYQDATGASQNYVLQLSAQPRLYINNINGYLQYASQPPPPMLWQCAAKGRCFGISQNAQTPRLYYSSQIQDAFPFEWNATNYAPIPTELGDVRSIEAIDDKIVVIGTRSLAVMNGDGPGQAAVAGDTATASPTPNDGFSLVQPVPTPVGAVGSGAPARTPDGIVFQGYSGVQLVGRDLSVQPVGAAVDTFTGRQIGNPGVILGRGVTLSSLQSVVFTCATGPALVYNYLTQRWSTWPLLPGAIGLTQRLDGGIIAALQPVSSGQYTALANSSTQGCDVVQLGASYSPIFQGSQSAPGLVVESPWILPSGESGGEAALWDCTVTGGYVGPHILQIEQTFNYVATYQAPIQFKVASAPNIYQYRVRPKNTARIWAARYRITILPLTTLGAGYFMATLGDLVLNYGNKQGTSRLSAATSG